MSRPPDSPYYPSSSTPSYPARPSAPPPRRGGNRFWREVMVGFMVLAILAIAIGGGYLLTNRSQIGGILPFLANATPVPTLPATVALRDIQSLYPNARISLRQPLNDQIDLVSVRKGTDNAPLDSVTATKILATFMRGYPKQTFWRWVDERDRYTATTYEVHQQELWVLTFATDTCLTSWAVYPVSPKKIITQGVSGHGFDEGVTAHPGVGIPPTNPYIGC